MFPDHSEIHANLQYRPELSWLSTYGTERLDAIRRGDLLSGGRYLDAATLAEILQGAGIPTITAGAKPVEEVEEAEAEEGLSADELVSRLIAAYKAAKRSP